MTASKRLLAAADALDARGDEESRAVAALLREIVEVVEESIAGGDCSYIPVVAGAVADAVLGKEQS